MNLWPKGSKEPKVRFWHSWPSPAAKRSLAERLARKVWLFRWDNHSQCFAATGIDWCQSKEYRDRKIARYFPKRNWVSDELPQKIRVFNHRVRNSWWEVQHRFQKRYRHHVLDLKLTPGYHSTDTKMLYAMFALVVDFVEVRLAHKNMPEEGETFLWKDGRSSEAGLKYLEWEINEPDCQMGSSPTQAESAQIKKDLYLWWAEQRPARMDPYVVYDLLKVKSDNSYKEKGLWGLFNSNHDRRPGECSNALEAFYAQEDKEMMEKCISILHSWWE